MFLVVISLHFVQEPWSPVRAIAFYILPCTVALHLDFWPVIGLPEFNFSSSIFQNKAEATAAISVITILVLATGYVLYKLYKKGWLMFYAKVYGILVACIVAVYLVASPRSSLSIYYLIGSLSTASLSIYIYY